MDHTVTGHNSAWIPGCRRHGAWTIGRACALSYVNEMASLRDTFTHIHRLACFTILSQVRNGGRKNPKPAIRIVEGFGDGMHGNGIEDGAFDSGVCAAPVPRRRIVSSPGHMAPDDQLHRSNRIAVLDGSGLA